MSRADRTMWRRWRRRVGGLMGSIGETCAFLATGVWYGPPDLGGAWLRADGSGPREPVAPGPEPRPGDPPHAQPTGPPRDPAARGRGRPFDQTELAGGTELTDRRGSTTAGPVGSTGPATTAARTPPGHPERVRPDQPASPQELLLWRDLHLDRLADRLARRHRGAHRTRITTDADGDPADGGPGRTADPTNDVPG